MTMPPNLQLLRALTRASVSQSCSYLNCLKLLPSTIVNPTSKQRYHISTNFCFSQRGFYDPFPTESSKDLVDSKSHEDRIMQNLEQTHSVEDVLSLVRRHLTVMNGSHQAYALQTLFYKHKNNLTSTSKEDIINKSEFKSLCNASLNHLRLMDLGEQINWFKVLSYFEVSSNTRIMQILLNLISKQVNDLTLRQIMYLDFLLSRQEKCPLVDALKIALPIVFEVKVEREMDSSNLEYLRDCLMYASTKPVSKLCFNFLVSLLSAYDQDISPQTAGSILRSLCDWKEYNDSHALLLLRVMDIVAVSADTLNLNIIHTILIKVLQKAEHYTAFQHVIFIEECIKQIRDRSDTHWWHHLLHLLSRVGTARFSSPLLADLVCSKIEENADKFLAAGVGAELKVIHSFSRYSNTKPKNWDRIEKLIVDKFRKHLHNDELPWPKICFYLATLDCWPSDIFRKTVDKNVIQSFMKHEKDTFRSSRILLEVHQAVHLLYPGDLDWSIPQPWWDKICTSVLADLKSASDVPSPLLPALAKGLGGQEYIHNNVVTQHFHFIDHVVVMRKGGYPIAVPSSTSDNKLSYLQEISVPAESLIVGVLKIKPALCSFNGQVMSGQQALYIRTLEAMGIPIVPIILSKWESLAEHEKIPYLMQRLRNKIEDYEAMAFL